MHHYYLFLSLCFPLVFSQSNSDTCSLCLDASTTSSWGPFVSTGMCQGCPGTEPGLRDCFANSDQGIILEPVRCKVNRSCSACSGSWSKWSNIDICKSSCQQLQARYCYEKSKIGRGNVRSSNCEGAGGRMEQQRTQSCFHGECKPQVRVTTIRQRILESASSLIETTPTPTINSNAVTRSTPGSNDKTSGSQTEETIRVQPEAELNQSQQILLPAILGSVGIICFAAIAISVSCMWSRKKRPGTDYPSYTTGTASSTITTREENYETVAPPLPSRASVPTTLVLPLTNQPQNVNNMLYHPMNGFDSVAVSPVTSNKTDSGTYLIPIENPVEQNSESIYSHIDEER